MTVSARNIPHLLAIAALAWATSHAGCKEAEEVPVPAVSPDVADATSEPDLADGDDNGAAWWSELDELPGALLSVWESGDGAELWTVGAVGDSTTGPMVLRRRDGAWTWFDTGVDENLWWVHGDPTGRVVMTGEEGRALAFDRSTETFEPLETGTDATLFGVWGPPAGGDLLAVGGYVHPKTGPPTLLRISAEGVATAESLPDGVADDATLFKVWGRADDDVWVVGNRGTLLHYDGVVWTPQTPPDAGARWVTVHGNPTPGLVVVVGGTNQGQVLERTDAAPTWTDRSPAFAPGLSGVFVTGDRAIAAGMVNAVARRRADAPWEMVEGPDLSRDWHGVLIDQQGDEWLAGGSLLSAQALNRGALVRFGPDRAAAAAPPPPPPRAPSVDADADGHLDASAADVSDVTEVVDSAEVLDSEPGPDAVDDVDTESSLTLTLGTASLGEFAPLPDGTDLEIVQGPQGGIHIEVAVELTIAADSPLASGSEIIATISGDMAIEGAVVGSTTLSNYLMPAVAPGVFGSGVMFLIFEQDIAAPYAGKAAQVSLTVALDGGLEAAAQVGVVLVDWF